MTPYKAIMTLRSMSQDGVNHVGEIADVIESMQNRLDAYEQGVQAREKMLREALERLACLGNGDRHGNSIGNGIAVDALAQPTDDTALKAALANERDRCAAEVYDDGKRNPIESARERIRALGDK